MNRKTIVMGVLWLGLLGGCGNKDDASAATDGDTSSGGEDPTATESDSGASTTAATSTTDSDTTTGGMSTGMDSAGFINPETTGDSGPSEPQPNGGMCASEGDCTSGFCYQLPTVGGVCSECLVDADCSMGTCSLEFDVMYAVCTDGSAGNMCNSDEGCMGDLVCTELIDTGGVFNANFCSQCGPTAPCDGDTICSPQYDDSAISGQFVCVEAGSVVSGQGCPVDDEGTGDSSVCADGHCEVVDVFQGFVTLGVCGECITDADCPEGQTCTGGEATMQGLTGSSCG